MSYIQITLEHRTIHNFQAQICNSYINSSKTMQIFVPNRKLAIARKRNVRFTKFEASSSRYSAAICIDMEEWRPDINLYKIFSSWHNS